MPQVQSLYDEHYAPEQIRKDQRRRILDMVKANAENPSIAIGLVRDYCKGMAKVGKVRFDNPESPKEIIVHTEGSTYYFRLRNTPHVEAPTL